MPRSRVLDSLLDCLPVVLGALSAVLGVFGGVVDGLHDVGVPGVEGDGLDELGHLVPELGGGEVGWSSLLPVTPPPLTNPNTTMAILRAMRMMRLVRLRLRTSLLVEALETTSRAVANSGASSAAARANMADPTRADLESIVMECDSER